MTDPTMNAPGTPEAGAKKEKKGKAMAVIIVAYVLAVLSAAALVELVLAPGMAGIPASVHGQVDVAGRAPAGSDGAGHGAKKRDKKERHGGGESAAAGDVYLIDDVVVNPAASGGMRYLAASVGLHSAAEGFIVNMKANEAPVKDALIRILSSKTVEDLADVSLRESMRSEILTEVQRIVPEEDVDAVYFMRFVLQ